MKTPRIFSVLLLVASTASGQLQIPATDRLTDYLNWFAPLDPTAGLVAPVLQSPGSLQIDTAGRDWTSWITNAPPTDLHGPITGVTSGLYCEVVFLGQTGDSWGRFGYTNNGTEHLLSLSGSDRQFGSYALPLPTEKDSLDFFVESPDDSGTWVRRFAFDWTLNPSLPSSGKSYFGTLAPITSVRGDGLGLAGDACIPFTVLAFTPESPASGTTPDLFVFAVRAGEARPASPIPEPSAYGLAAVAALIALIACRRLRSARRRATTT